MRLVKKECFRAGCTLSDDLPGRMLTGEVIVKSNIRSFAEEYGIEFQDESRVDHVDAVIEVPVSRLTGPCRAVFRSVPFSVFHGSEVGTGTGQYGACPVSGQRPGKRRSSPFRLPH